MLQFTGSQRVRYDSVDYRTIESLTWGHIHSKRSQDAKSEKITSLLWQLLFSRYKQINRSSNFSLGLQ